jgi:FkbM family methyltransferase
VPSDAATGASRGAPYVERCAVEPAAREAASRLAAAGRAPIYPLEFRSQFGEDALIWRLCGEPLEGRFIEVGAFDGYSFSATYALECLGWTGLLIEPIPEAAQRCRERRRHSRVVHAALGAEAGGETRFMVTEDEHGGMLSYAAGVIPHKKRIEKSASRAITVPVTTLDALLEEHEGGIDAAVIDVEGSEVPLLRGFDLRRHRPKLLLIEDNARGDRTPVSEYMAAMPYTQVATLKVNRVYVREDLAPEWARRLGSAGLT